tara:strand:- start:66 stop:662 length:597 start_codon:yes stop_codon:yes gene_type:complete
MISVELVQQAHKALTPELREYWHKRGVTDDFLDTLKIGFAQRGDWKWFTIPILDFHGKPLFFKMKKARGGPDNQPKGITWPKGNKATLYPLPYLHDNIRQIFLCEGEPDCLAMLSNEMEAISSTAGAKTFPEEFLDHFPRNIQVICCFDKDEAGKAGTEKVKQLFEEKRQDIKFSIFRIPEDCPGKDMTDYFLWKNGS